MRCNYLTLTEQELTASLSTHLRFVVGLQSGRHRTAHLWADSANRPRRLVLTEYPREDWVFDTTATAIVAFDGTGRAVGIHTVLPPPRVDSTVSPPRVLSGGNVSSDLSPMEEAAAHAFALWLWNGRCPRLDG